MVPMACQCRLKFRHWLPLVTIGTNGMPMFTSGYQWFLPLAANLADNLERGKITNSPNDVIFKMTTNEHEEQICARNEGNDNYFLRVNGCKHQI